MGQSGKPKRDVIPMEEGRDGDGAMIFERAFRLAGVDFRITVYTDGMDLVVRTRDALRRRVS
jgi:hypothetical protein